MSELPPHVAEAGLLFQRTSIEHDPVSFQMIIEFGRAQIDATYPENPVRAPLNIFRRQLAHMEWNRVIATAGRELRGTVANSLVRQLEFEIKRREDDILARDAEARRREAVTFDGNHRVTEYKQISQIDLQNQKDLLTHEHNLRAEAEKRASEQRITEMEAANEAEIKRLCAEALMKTMGTSSSEDVFKMVTKINAEVQRIRSDTTLTNDDKHVQIKTVLDSLPTMIYHAQRREH